MELRGNKKNAPELQIFRVEEERRIVRFYAGVAGTVHAIIVAILAVTRVAPFSWGHYKYLGLTSQSEPKTRTSSPSPGESC